MGRRFQIGVVCAVALAALCGCQAGRRSFEINSDTRTPAFGLELVPRRHESKPPEIAQTGGEVPPRAVEPAETDELAAPSAWSRLWGRFSKPRRIPLPRTDLDGGAATDSDAAEARSADGF